jgi:hypothetical protein
LLLDQLRRDPSLIRSPQTDEWASKLDTIADWDSKRIDEFVAHVEGVEPGDGLHIFADLSEEHLETFSAHAPDEWESLVLAYCEWARASFRFEFCDVIAGCLRWIYTSPSSKVSVQANVATAMATLGARNNRWYCMRLLNPMTDNRITDTLGQRIAMEIRANELHEDFEHCAREVYGWSRDAYHPHILDALDEARIPAPGMRA